MADPIESHKAVSNVALDIVLTLLTCGIYGLFWQARIFRVVNAFLGREKYSFWLWFLLSLITCNIYNIFAQYDLAKSINEVQAKLGKPVNENLPLLNLVFSILPLHVIYGAIDQSEINAWYE